MRITESDVIHCNNIRALVPLEYRRKLSPTSRRLVKCKHVLWKIVRGTFKPTNTIASNFYYRFTREAAMATLRIMNQYTAITYEDVQDDYERHRNIFSLLPVNYRDDKMNPQDIRLIYVADVLQRIVDGKQIISNAQFNKQFKTLLYSNNVFNNYNTYLQAAEYYEHHDAEAAEFILEAISNWS